MQRFAQHEKHTVRPIERMDAAPFCRHAWQFIRTAAHCCHRASLAGIDVEPSRVFGDARYGLSPAVDYVAALDVELSTCEDMSFAEILRRKLPEQFARLWQADFMAWLDSADLRQLSDTNISEFLIDESIIEGANLCQ